MLKRASVKDIVPAIDTPLLPLEKVALERSVSSPANKQTAKTLLFGPPKLAPSALSPTTSDIYPFGRHNPFETDFTDHVLVAEGGFGKVYKCRSRIDGRHYAVKLEQFHFTPKAIFNPNEIHAKLLREVHLLAALDHENVCRYYNTWIFGKLVSELNSGQPGTSLLHRTILDSSSSDEVDSESSNSSDSSEDISRQWSSVSSDSCGISFERTASTLETDNGSDENVPGPVCPQKPLPKQRLLGPAAQKSSLSLQMDVYIQMALYQGNSLQHWLHERQSIDVNANLTIFRQIVAGLKYIHAQGLIHRDIKPANIFLTLDACVKIGDFGLATHSTTGIAAAGVGTPLYSSPEQIRGNHCTGATDVFSLGLVLCEIFCNFKTQMEKHVTLMNVRNRGIVPASVPPEIADIICQLVNEDPVKRPTCCDIEQMEELMPFSLSPSCNTSWTNRMRSWTANSLESESPSQQNQVPTILPLTNSTMAQGLLADLEALESQQNQLLQSLAPSPVVTDIQNLATRKADLLGRLRQVLS